VGHQRAGDTVVAARVGRATRLRRCVAQSSHARSLIGQPKPVVFWEHSRLATNVVNRQRALTVPLPGVSQRIDRPSARSMHDQSDLEGSRSAGSELPLQAVLATLQPIEGVVQAGPR